MNLIKDDAIDDAEGEDELEEIPQGRTRVRVIPETECLRNVRM